MASSTVRLSLAFVLAAVIGASAQNCAPGTYSTTGAAPCTQCPPGTFQANSAATDCQEADPGYYAAGPGATFEAICPDGTYSIGGTEACTPCPDGATCVGTGNTAPAYPSSTPGNTSTGPAPSPTPTTGYQGPGYPYDPNYNYPPVDNNNDDDGSYYDFDGFIPGIDTDDFDDRIPQLNNKRATKAKKKQSKASPSPSPVAKKAPKKQRVSPSPSPILKRERKPKRQVPSPSPIFKRDREAKRQFPSPSPIFKKRQGVPSPSPSPVSRRQLRPRDEYQFPDLEALPVCPPGQRECPVGGLYSYTDGYECVDIRNSLESCGGCVADDSPNGEYNFDGGRDCGAIPNVDTVSCSKGQCIIQSCNKGYIISSDGSRCQASFK